VTLAFTGTAEYFEDNHQGISVVEVGRNEALESGPLRKLGLPSTAGP